GLPFNSRDSGRRTHASPARAPAAARPMPSDRDNFPFLAGGGISGRLARSVDWARTPLGAPDGWPRSLKTIVGVILRSRHPMFLWWGPELIQVYNDAYLPSFGGDK